jgi:hypothetical protein
MADPIDWSQLNPAQGAALAQTAQTRPVMNFTNPNAMGISPYEQGQLQVAQQSTQIQRLSALAQRNYQQQMANAATTTASADTFKAQTEATNDALTQQRGFAVDQANIEKTNAESQGTQADVESKTRENIKQNMLLNAAQQGGLAGYMSTLQTVDPDKYLTVAKTQQDINTSLLGQQKSILDLQGAQREQAVKSYNDAHKLAYLVETSTDPSKTYDLVKGQFNQMGLDLGDTYSPEKMTAVFAAGQAAMGSGANAGINPAALSLIPQGAAGANLGATEAFTSGMPPPVAARAAAMSSVAPLAVNSAQALQQTLSQNQGKAPLIGSLASSPIGSKVPEKLLPEEAQNWKKNVENYQTGLRSVLKGTPEEIEDQLEELTPVYGEAPEVNSSKLQRGTALMGSLSTMVNPHGLGMPLPTPGQAPGATNAQTPAATKITGAMITPDFIQYAVSKGYYPNAQVAAADLMGRVNQ